MALLFMEGFEAYNDLTDMIEGGWGVNGDSIVAGRNGGNAWMGNSTGEIAVSSFPASTDTYYVGFACKVEAFTTLTIIMSLQHSVSGRGNFIYINNTGLLEVRNYTTLLATSTNSVILDTWNYIVLKVYLHDTLGTVELWINGAKEIDETGLDTLYGSNPVSINEIELRGASSTTFSIDDIYIGDDSGTDMTDQVGDCSIQLVTPDANGTTNDFTPITSGASNYEEVDEIIVDDDTTYVSSSTVNDKELYGCSALTGSIDTVHAVKVRNVARKEDTGNRTVKPVCRSSGTEVEGAEAGLTTGYSVVSDIYENDPNGGINWTTSAVNAMEVGLKIHS